MLITTLALLALASQDLSSRQPLEVILTPRAPDKGGRGGLRWSPKGATVPLAAKDTALEGQFLLGPEGSAAIAVRLERSSGAERYDLLWIDLDRDGRPSEAERLSTTPSETRGKWWSSFEAELAVPVPAQQPGALPTSRPYPVSLWFVEDPQEPAAEPALRWSRRGWHQGALEIDGRPALVLVTEMVMDGVFDQRDVWALARDQAELLAAAPRGLDGHVWLDGQAYRPVRIDPHGARLAFEPFDPGFTEEEERARNDVYAADRAAPRAAQPLAFGTDLAAALERAGRERRRVLVDFETTWCGPCKQMENLVYSAAPVVDAARGVLAVKLDGDEQRELVRRYGVGAYPTMLLLAPDGSELRRAVGYRSVVEMVEFLRE